MKSKTIYIISISASFISGVLLTLITLLIINLTGNESVPPIHEESLYEYNMSMDRFVYIDNSNHDHPISDGIVNETFYSDFKSEKLSYKSESDSDLGFWVTVNGVNKHIPIYYRLEITREIKKVDVDVDVEQVFWNNETLINNPWIIYLWFVWDNM